MNPDKFALILLGCMAGFLFLTRQYGMIEWHSKQLSYIARLLENTPGVEDYNALGAYYHEIIEFYRQKEVRFINCLAEQLRCIDMSEFSTRRTFSQHDELTCSDIGRSTNIWSLVFQSADGIDMLVRRSDGKMCLSNDQFSNLLHEQKGQVENEYQGELHAVCRALWRLYARGSYASMEENVVYV